MIMLNPHHTEPILGRRIGLTDQWYFPGNWQRTWSQKWDLQWPYRPSHTVSVQQHLFKCGRLQNWKQNACWHLIHIRKNGSIHDFNSNLLPSPAEDWVSQHVALHEVTQCMVVWCTQNAPRLTLYGSRFLWHQPCQRCKYTTSVDIQKRAIKSYSLM